MRKTSVVVITLLVVFLVTGSVRAFAPQDGPRDFKFEREIITVPSEKIMDAWTSFQRWSRGVWTVRWNPRTGVPLSILGAGNICHRDRDPVKTARAFLRESSSFFRLRDGFEDLVLKRVISSGGSHHVFFEQIFDGIPVFQCGLGVHISPNGEIRQVGGEYVPVPDVRGIWSLSEGQALDRALANLNCSVAGERPEIERVLYFDGVSTVRAWRVNVSTERPLGAWQMVVDASNGRVLYRCNQIDFFTGQGSVYGSHPLEGDVVERSLPHMKKATDFKGLYIRVFNEDVKDASEESGRYFYDSDNTHFDEVMAYHHVNLIHDYFAALGFHGLDKAKLKAKVHVGTDFDNAYFDPWHGGFFFGDGKKLNDLAKEAGVIYHEYTHAVTRKINSLRYGEAGAMNEAFSDYFACTQDEEPMIGEYCCERLERECFRDLESTKHYPEDIQHEPHKDGEIYGSTLWDLRIALGKEVTDLLVHRSRYHLRTGAKFVDGLEALVAVDLDFFKGEHEETIRQVFAGRGISTGGRSLVDLLLEKRFIRLLEQSR